MEPVAVIVILVLMFTVAAVIVATEDGAARRGERPRTATSRAGDKHDRH